MNSLMFNSVLSLSAIGITAASILFIISKKFRVFEDPKIDEVEGVLPGANCGGCGFAGCRNFAEATVKEGNLSNLFCPVGGNDCMSDVAEILGIEVKVSEPQIAVLKCNGSRENAPPKIVYDGALSCQSAHSLSAGESGCAYGCLGLGDCEVACNFDALFMDTKSGLPVVDEEKCVACGACVSACPRNIYELRPKGKDNKRVYVGCMNKEKGAAAKKNCKVACIGCGRCAKVTESTSVSINNFLSYIDTNVDVVEHGPYLIGSCPTKAIIGVGVEGIKPPPKTKPKINSNNNSRPTT